MLGGPIIRYWCPKGVIWVFFTDLVFAPGLPGLPPIWGKPDPFEVNPTPGRAETGPKHPKNIPKLILGHLGAIWGTFGLGVQNRLDREISAPQVGSKERFKGNSLKAQSRF